MINKVFVLVFLLFIYSNGDDCFPDKYYYNYDNNQILNIPIKQDCMYTDRILNYSFNLGYFFFAGKNPFQVQKVFSSIKSPAYFQNNILNDLNITKGKYQPMLIYSNNDKFTFSLVIEIDESIYKYNVTYDYFNKTNKVHLLPIGYMDTDKEQHYPVFINNNKLIFIATNDIKVIVPKSIIYNDIYFIEIELPFKNIGYAEVIHRGYYDLPRNFNKYSSTEIKEYFKREKAKLIYSTPDIQPLGCNFRGVILKPTSGKKYFDRME